MKDYKEYLHSILNGEYKPMEAENDLLFLKELYYNDPFDVYIYIWDWITSFYNLSYDKTKRDLCEIFH